MPYKRFRDLDDAFEYLNSTAKNKRLWTILHFDVGGYFVFCSSQNAGQQMFNLGKMITTYSGHYGRGMPHGRELAHYFSGIFKGRIEQYETPLRGGHAEEEMIRCFDDVFGIVRSESTGPLLKATVLNSDSPCTPHDRLPSDNLPGWPVSCMNKLVMLAHRYNRLDWTVLYQRRYGYYGGKDFDDSNIKACMEGFSLGHGIDIYPFTPELKELADRYLNI